MDSAAPLSSGRPTRGHRMKLEIDSPSAYGALGSERGYSADGRTAIVNLLRLENDRVSLANSHSRPGAYIRYKMQSAFHSMRLSARCVTLAGSSSPIAFATPRFTVSSRRVTVSTGICEGEAPRKIRSAIAGIAFQVSATVVP